MWLVCVIHLCIILWIIMVLWLVCSKLRKQLERDAKHRRTIRAPSLCLHHHQLPLLLVLHLHLLAGCCLPRRPAQQLVVRWISNISPFHQRCKNVTTRVITFSGTTAAFLSAHCKTPRSFKVKAFCIHHQQDECGRILLWVSLGAFFLSVKQSELQGRNILLAVECRMQQLSGEGCLS